MVPDTDYRDTNVVLSPMQQHKVVLRSEPRIDFGIVCEGSTNMRDMEITNTTDRYVLVSLESTCLELSQSEPLGQEVPPGETAKFNVILSNLRSYSVSTAPPQRYKAHHVFVQDRNVNTTLTYVLNRRHRVDVPITATVVSPNLRLSESELRIPVGCRAVTLRSTSSVTLSNPFSYNCKFSWLLHRDCQSFRVTPGTTHAMESF